MRPGLRNSRITKFCDRSPRGFISRQRYISTTGCGYAPRATTVEKGNAFEGRSLNLLQQDMSMSLKRVGGREDGGIDLLGWWWLPHDIPDASKQSSSFERRRIRIIGQCKAEKKKLGPNYVRELEGVLYRFLTMSSTNSSLFPPAENFNEPIPIPIEHSQFPMVALLISESPFTKSTLLRALSSPIPFFLLHLPPLNDSLDLEARENGDPVQSLGTFGAAVCNPALCGSQGLLKGKLEIRWERHFLGQQGRPAIWWNNERLQSKVPDFSISETAEES